MSLSGNKKIYSPLQICGIVTVSLIGLFFLLIIIVGIVRVLETTTEQSLLTTNNTNVKKVQPNQKCVDFMITDPIDIDIESMSRNQECAMDQGMTVLVAQNNENDGFYVIDIDLSLIRIDCLKPNIEYVIKSGKNQERKYRYEENTDLQPHLSRKIITKETNLDIPLFLRDDIGELIIYITDDVDHFSLEFSNNYCCLKIMNQSTKNVIMTAKLQKQSWKLDSGKIYNGSIFGNKMLIHEVNVTAIQNC